MTIRNRIVEVRDAIRGGNFVNEASVCTGIVLPVLSELGWPVFTPQIVAPEYTIEGRRVDYALCHPRMKPAVLVEVKQPGRSDGGDRQLFEYAFHIGVPMAILTDGQEWNFYLPAEQGDYQERRVYKLDLVERDLDECEDRLNRYLAYPLVCSGQAFENARADYQGIRRQREIEANLPLAWRQLVDSQDQQLLDLVADQVEGLCGYKPDPDVVAAFLIAQLRPGTHPRAPLHAPQPNPVLPRKTRGASVTPLVTTGFVLAGNTVTCRSGRDAMVQLFTALAARDPSFLERFAALPKHGRRRRFLASNREDLYPGRPDLAREYSHEVSPGWWLGTNYSIRAMTSIIEKACEVAKLKLGRDVQVKLD